MTPPTINSLANAIYIAEGGIHTKYPYGIIRHFSIPPRTVCLNTIKSTMRKYHIDHIDRHFIYLLADKYCPSKSDPTGNINWKHNVVRILHL